MSFSSHDTFKSNLHIQNAPSFETSSNPGGHPPPNTWVPEQKQQFKHGAVVVVVVGASVVVVVAGGFVPLHSVVQIVPSAKLLAGPHLDSGSPQAQPGGHPLFSRFHLFACASAIQSQLLLGHSSGVGGGVVVVVVVVVGDKHV